MRERAGIWYMTLAAIAVFAASALLSAALYDYVIVPRLPSVRSVPFSWWLAAGLPIITAGFVFGWLVRSVASFLLWSIAGAVGINAYVTWASLVGRRPFVNQPPAAEAPFVFWTVGLATAALVVGLFLAIGLSARTLLAVLGRLNGRADR